MTSKFHRMNWRHVFLTKLDFSEFSHVNKQIWPIRSLHLATSALVAQNGDSKNLRRTAVRCCRSIGPLKWFLCLFKCDPALPKTVQTASLTSWNTQQSGRDSSTIGWNHEILPAAKCSWDFRENSEFQLIFQAETQRCSCFWEFVPQDVKYREENI